VDVLPAAVTALGARLQDLGWVPDLLVGGSLATGDYVPGVSDLDLVAIVEGRLSPARVARLVAIHEDLDRGEAAGADLGCVYVAAGRISAAAVRHPTWTHGYLVYRTVSGITRAELARHGFPAYGRAPSEVLPPVTDDEIRGAARDELCGYWAWAARHPRMWLSPVIAELGLTSMARGRSAMRTGQLLSKGDAIEQAHAPDWLKDQLRARRRGEQVTSPRLPTAWIAWTDARRTVRAARAGAA